MIAATALLLQVAAPPPASDALSAASPRTLTGRFTCDAGVYEVQVTATPPARAGAPVVLDRLTLDGRSVDAGSLAETARVVARLGDVQSLDVRCRAGGGELRFYGTLPQPDGSVRNARVRGDLRGLRVSGVALALQQR